MKLGHLDKPIRIPPLLPMLGNGIKPKTHN